MDLEALRLDSVNGIDEAEIEAPEELDGGNCVSYTGGFFCVFFLKKKKRERQELKV